MKKFIVFYSLCLLFSCITRQSIAQMFSEQNLPGNEVASTTDNLLTEKTPSPESKKTRVVETDQTIDQITKAFATKKVSAEDNDNPLKDVAQALEESKRSSSDQESLDDTIENEDVFIPKGELYRLDTPTKDGSLRGGQSFVQIDQKGRMKKTTNIFLFFDKFQILNSNSKVPTCNVRFNVLSTLDQKINQLDVKLVWPEMTTGLSFSNILPNTQTYYNYALLGKGCFNMDKAPNIIVNRCRIKGMNASLCANKLIWLSK